MTDRNFSEEIEKDYQAKLNTGTKKSLEDYLENIQMYIETEKDMLLENYRHYYNNTCNNIEVFISANEKELDFLLHRENEIKNAILDRF